MADRTALGMIGLMLGAATIFVMMVGGVVIGDHLTGRLHMDEVGLRVATLPTTTR